MKVFWILLLLTFTASLCEEDIERHRKALITYSLWIGDRIPHKMHNMVLLTRSGQIFYEVMEQAAEHRPEYEFESIEYDKLGHYITCIGGKCENKETDHYWMVYQMRRMPDPLNPPKDRDLAQYGVDRLHVRHRDHFLFWYRYVQLNHTNTEE